MTTSKILIVDDNLASRELLLAILKRSSYDILEACNGKEALDVIVGIRPDLVLLDVEMPVLDGISVVRRLRQDSRFASLPVLAVTADAMQGTRDRILAEGFTGYVTKPIDASLIRKQVREILGH
jgi:CheY-like chemotaxis protein